jgi:hypothetical protein
MTLSPPRLWLAAALAAVSVYALCALCDPAAAQDKKKAKAAAKAAKVELTFPPKLPGGKDVLTVTSPEFLKAPETIGKDVLIAKTPPTVDFVYYPCQTYPGKIWSNWGDGLAVNGKYYSSLGDHDAPQGNAFVYEYDPQNKVLRLLVDLVRLLQQMIGYYIPGKIHGRLDMGKDGWLYFSTHRGGTNVTSDKYHYQGDWILRCNPSTNQSEIVAHGPVPKHCIPNSVVDPERLIFYGGTAPGSDAKDKGVQFFAYDLAKRKLLYSGPDGPPRYMILAKSSGKIYYVSKENDVGPLMCYDPAKGGAPYRIDATLGLRAATQETPQGMVYTVSKGFKGNEAVLFAFNTKTEQVEVLGPAAAGSNHYITSIDADPSGRYLYYIPGAHGGSERDGSAVIQYDTKTRQRKVIAFLHPYFKDNIGATPVGTFSSAIDPQGDKLYITWNVNRGGRNWDCCALTVIHIPASERQP